MNSELKNIIQRIDQLRSEVDSYRPLKPEQEQRLLQKIRLDWNFHSSHIEGNSLTYSETKSFLLWHITADGKPFRDYLEMKGHNEAVEYLLDVLKGTEIDMTEHLIRHLHQTILQEEFEADAVTSDGKPAKRMIKPGRYKSIPNHVKTKSGAMFYFATPEDTPAQMTDLMTWYNKELDENKSHPVIIASLFHYKFVRIHPFDDGNGRMARLLMNLILMKFGYPPVIVPFGIKDDYYNALQFADADDFDKFILLIGERLVESLSLVLKVGKNDSIVEYEDIEKMALLLRKKMDWKGLDEEIKIEKNVESIISIYENTITPLLLELNDVFDKVDSFFSEVLIEFSFNQSVPIILKRLSTNEALEYIKKFGNNLRYGYIAFNFKGLIKGKKVDLPEVIYFRFDNRSYIVDYGNNSIKNNVLIVTNGTYLQFERRYHQNLEKSEIKEISKYLFTDLYNKLDKLIQ